MSNNITYVPTYVTWDFQGGSYQTMHVACLFYIYEVRGLSKFSLA